MRTVHFGAPFLNSPVKEPVVTMASRKSISANATSALKLDFALRKRNVISKAELDSSKGELNFGTQKPNLISKRAELNLYAHQPDGLLSKGWK
ncbi:hypothetical protein Nepgr_012035 [Nepenthes gracilis]|uniref:Uncharacterized protein n=1 Tax=Nepenthes gracilis TaxID=150966 RepID=A0AAD3SG92_NEPGR|nr:hypothetical protein Nepgr_012035 [Nepenthes gracilis]